MQTIRKHFKLIILFCLFFIMAPALSTISTISSDVVKQLNLKKDEAKKYRVQNYFLSPTLDQSSKVTHERQDQWIDESRDLFFNYFESQKEETNGFTRKAVFKLKILFVNNFIIYYSANIFDYILDGENNPTTHDFEIDLNQLDLVFISNDNPNPLRSKIYEIMPCDYTWPFFDSANEAQRKRDYFKKFVFTSDFVIAQPNIGYELFIGDFPYTEFVLPIKNALDIIPASATNGYALWSGYIKTLSLPNFYQKIDSTDLLMNLLVTKVKIDELYISVHRVWKNFFCGHAVNLHITEYYIDSFLVRFLEESIDLRNESSDIKDIKFIKNIYIDATGFIIDNNSFIQGQNKLESISSFVITPYYFLCRAPINKKVFKGFSEGNHKPFFSFGYGMESSSIKFKEAFIGGFVNEDDYYKGFNNNMIRIKEINGEYLNKKNSFKKNFEFKLKIKHYAPKTALRVKKYHPLFSSNLAYSLITNLKSYITNNQLEEEKHNLSLRDSILNEKNHENLFYKWQEISNGGLLKPYFEVDDAGNFIFFMKLRQDNTIEQNDEFKEEILWTITEDFNFDETIYKKQARLLEVKKTFNFQFSKNTVELKMHPVKENDDLPEYCYDNEGNLILRKGYDYFFDVEVKGFLVTKHKKDYYFFCINGVATSKYKDYKIKFRTKIIDGTTNTLAPDHYFFRVYLEVLEDLLEETELFHKCDISIMFYESEHLLSETNRIPVKYYKPNLPLHILNQEDQWDTNKPLKLAFDINNVLWNNADKIELKINNVLIPNNGNEKYNVVLDHVAKTYTISFKDNQKTPEDLGEKNFKIEYTPIGESLISAEKKFNLYHYNFQLKSVHLDEKQTAYQENNQRTLLYLEVDNIENISIENYNHFSFILKENGSEEEKAVDNTIMRYEVPFLNVHDNKKVLAFKIQFQRVITNGYLKAKYDLGGFQAYSSFSNKFNVKDNEINSITSTVIGNPILDISSGHAAFNLLIGVNNETEDNYFGRFSSEKLAFEYAKKEDNSYSAWKPYDKTKDTLIVDLENGVQKTIKVLVKTHEIGEYKIRFVYNNTYPTTTKIIDTNTEGSAVTFYQNSQVTQIRSSLDTNKNIYTKEKVKYDLTFSPDTSSTTHTIINQSLIKPKYAEYLNNSWSEFKDINDWFEITYANNFKDANVIFKREGKYKLIFNYDQLEDANKAQAKEITVRSLTDINSIKSTLNESTSTINIHEEAIYDLLINKDAGVIIDAKLFVIKKANGENASFETEIKSVRYANDYSKAYISFKTAGQFQLSFNYGTHADENKTPATVTVTPYIEPKIKTLRSSLVGDTNRFVGDNLEFNLTFEKDGNPLVDSNLLKLKKADGSEFREDEAQVSYAKNCTKAFVVFKKPYTGIVKFYYTTIVDKNQHNLNIKAQPNPSLISFGSAYQSGIDPSGKNKVGDKFNYSLTFKTIDGYRIDTSKINVQALYQDQAGKKVWKTLTDDIVNLNVSIKNEEQQEYTAIISFKEVGIYHKVRFTYLDKIDTAKENELKTFIIDRNNGTDQPELTSLTTNKITPDEEIKVDQPIIFGITYNSSVDQLKINEEKFFVEFNDSGDHWELVPISDINIRMSISKDKIYIIFKKQMQIKIRLGYINEANNKIYDQTSSYTINVLKNETNQNWLVKSLTDNIVYLAVIIILSTTLFFVLISKKRNKQIKK